jgi:hypothetical protein
MELIILAAAVVGIPFLLFGTSEWFTSTVRMFHRDDSAGRALRFNLWHLVAAVGLSALLFAALTAGPRQEGFLLFLVALVIMTLFFRTWRQEFLFLMGLRDDDFPGRYDKLIWIFMLTAMAPVGLWFFRSYHLSHWPEPKTDPDHARTAPEAL